MSALPVREAAPGAVFQINVADPLFQSRIGGFYPGTPGWLWTSQNFWISIDAPQVGKPVKFELDFAVPKELLEKTNDVTLTATINQVPLGKQRYTKAGHGAISWDVPAGALEPNPARVEFKLDKTGQRSDGQPLGIIVVAAAMHVDEAAHVDQTAATQLAHAGYDRLVMLRNASLSADRQREMMKLFHDIPVWREMWFQNVRIEKNPLDLWMIQQMIYELRPEFIVETGTWRGGSALYWAYTLNGMGLDKSRVFTVDIQNVTGNAAENPFGRNT